MLTLKETELDNVIRIDVDGAVTKEDAEKSASFIKEHYGDDKELSALVYIKDFDGVGPVGMVKGTIMDISHWNQYKKFAVVTDAAWQEGGAKLVGLLPGIEVKQFDKAQEEQAYEWLGD
ncbi:STAS/SEC14 domain-containing protein [Salinicoccus hispanicus]|uniref:STAS/SEC14 domain-containing protein n=1 Tax=Salinicoccus hispanicus TaxID=157225 RepID=A0A6N8U2T9_9STAP|nr:STAS/SEC14 domain-containing protein [Salinicoccus hispanicus]MXQ50481.1 STAS/SEC14 domain-containing protein [Salinicoccus hispanicus]